MAIGRKVIQKDTASTTNKTDSGLPAYLMLNDVLNALSKERGTYDRMMREHLEKKGLWKPGKKWEVDGEGSLV